MSTADRCHVLYELSKKIVKKEDKPTDEYQFEKDKEEYTFAPKITREKVEDVAPLNDQMVPETIERLKKAREEHERVKRGTERGADDTGMHFDLEVNRFKKPTDGSKLLSASHISTQSKGSAKKESKKSPATKSQVTHSPKPAAELVSTEPKTEAAPALVPTNVPQAEQQLPMPTLPAPNTETEVIQPAKEGEEENSEKLYIDVNLGETVERIVVRKGDTAAALAEKFAHDHGMSMKSNLGVGLGEDVKAKLETLIEGQMKNVLDNIEEVNEADHKSN